MKSDRCVYVPGPLIVGAGPSGLATSACLKVNGVPSIILERSDCIASLWQLKTYDRLKLHLPKQFCQLPYMDFPPNYPTYPTRKLFIDYLESYAKKFDIKPLFNETVEKAEYDPSLGFWRVRSVNGERSTEYVCRWLVVASGENAEAVVPEIEGMEEFCGEVKHTSLYKGGEEYRGKNVLVVGCGNSGMEVHVLPREMLGKSTFGLSMWLLKWLPISLVDRILLAGSRLTLGDTGKLGLDRPSLGPLQLKNLCGKTPVLDVGTLEKIRSGHIKVFPTIKCVGRDCVEFVNGDVENFDTILLATGYKSNVPSWLKKSNMFSEKDGFPKKPFPNGWKGNNGLYAVGFTKRGILGSALEGKKIAEDVHLSWKSEAKHFISFARALLRPQLINQGRCLTEGKDR
ncbi:hypothetical protein ACFE04_013223 [Oxalis oulophora]